MGSQQTGQCGGETWQGLAAYGVSPKTVLGAKVKLRARGKYMAACPIPTSLPARSRTVTGLPGTKAPRASRTAQSSLTAS